MRNIILGTVAGLLVGTLGSLAYTQYFSGTGQQNDLQAQLDAADAKLAKAEADEKFLKEQNNSETEQLNQVLASKQPGDSATPAAAAPAANPLTIGGMQITPDMVRGFMSMMQRGGPGGMRSPEQRMFLLNARLKLDPNQTKAIKDAMDADEQARRDAFRQARQNHTPVDQQALAAASTMDKTLSSVLSPSQQVQYQQLQSDEKQARAEVSATQQVDNMMPLLQLSDDQKEKVMTALYQQQLSAPDGAAMAQTPNPLQALAQQGQSVQSAMKGVLSPDQYALYQQSEQVTQQAIATNGFGGGGNGRRNRANGGGADGQSQAAAGNAPATAPATTAATGTTTSTDTSTPASTTGTTTPDGSASTNAPSATTNAASVTPPPPGV